MKCSNRKGKTLLFRLLLENRALMKQLMVPGLRQSRGGKSFLRRLAWGGGEGALPALPIPTSLCSSTCIARDPPCLGNHDIKTETVQGKSSRGLRGSAGPIPPMIP